MKKILTVFILMITVSVFAQKRAITGKVSDDKGLPLPGVSLVIKGTKTGTLTDFDGKFSIMAENKDVLVFSFISMQTQSVPVGNATNLNVSMKTDTQSLDEVVVVGYGTVKKKDLTGSVSVINTKETLVAPQANLQNALQGRAAGVQVTSNNGSPGNAPDIIIRGGNSITGGNAPLYVIDGYVGAGEISSLNPSDIESMQVLKDASSTAIYGARGTNGVILITTKKGKKGVPVVNFSGTSGIQYLPKRIDVQSSKELATWLNNISPDQNNLPYDLNNLPGVDTNWQDELIRPAAISDYQLSVSGGSDNNQYYISGGYLKQDGIVKGSDFERFSFRSNIDVKLSKTFKAGANITLSRRSSNNNTISFQSLLRQDPSKPVYDDKGVYYAGASPILGIISNNFVADAELNKDFTKLDKIFVNTYVQADLFKDFMLKSTFGGNFLYSKNDTFIPSTNPSKINNNKALASGSTTSFYDTDFLNENTFNYNKTIGNHSINLVGGLTFQKSARENMKIVASNIPSDGVGVYNFGLAPAENVAVTSSYTEEMLVGSFGKVNYSFKDRYLFTASLRRDGSSKLGINNRYETFPAVSFGWKVNEESFMKNIKAIDKLKLRMSYGKTGNQNANAFGTIAGIGVDYNTIIVNGISLAGASQGNLAQPNLGWEITNQYDAAVEVSLFKSRLSAEVDVYYKKTTDLLLSEPQLNFTGITTLNRNIGSIQNKGIDISLNGVIFRNKNFNWDMSLTISKYENEVLDLGRNLSWSTNTLAGANDSSGEIRIGEPIGIFVGAIYDGFDPATGKAIFRDISGPDGVPDGVYSALYDDTIIGNANPDFYGGLQSNFKYKNFDLSANFTFSVGNENYNEEAVRASDATLNSYSFIRNNMWTVANKDNALFPAMDSSGNVSYLRSSSLYIQDASYIRLGTLQFGYTLPTGLIKGLTKLRTYVTGTNLFLLKNKDYWGYDPDTNASSGTNAGLQRGYDAIGYPKNTSILFGIDVTF